LGLTYFSEANYEADFSWVNFAKLTLKALNPAKPTPEAPTSKLTLSKANLKGANFEALTSAKLTRTANLEQATG